MIMIYNIILMNTYKYDLIFTTFEPCIYPIDLLLHTTREGVTNLLVATGRTSF